MGSSNKDSITILGRRSHKKASEEYVDVIFKYDDLILNWSVPIEYRRTGTDLSTATDVEIAEYLEKVYDLCQPAKWSAFVKEQASFWASRPNASITKGFYDELEDGFQWKSIKHDLPANSNSQRRIQDLKEMGYTIATSTTMKHIGTGETATHHLLIPIPRGGITGYETWSPALRARIIKVLGGVDAYEGPRGNVHSLLPDHKFPEIRWDENVRRDDLESLTDEEIIRDFQLINNQRNQQKREACRKCFQTGERPALFGIEYFSEGSKPWPEDVPTRGKDAEPGCQGCGWYDISAWRNALNKKLAGEAES